MVLFTGKTVEEAIEKGLIDLGISRMQARIRVVSREKKGFLGFGKKPAQVQVEAIDQEPTQKSNQAPNPKIVEQTEAPVQEQSQSIPANGDKSQTVSEKPLATAKTQETKSYDNHQRFDDFVAKEFDDVSDNKTIDVACQEVSDYIQNVIYEMDLEVSIEASHNRRHINLQIETQEPGRVIGYHGKVLKSLQLLAQNFLHDRYAKHYSVTLNVHDYMEHRAEILIDFANKIAQRVLETGQSYHMDPMSNIERKIVHKTITGVEGVDSYSEGDDPNRYVVVAPR